MIWFVPLMTTQSSSLSSSHDGKHADVTTMWSVISSDWIHSQHSSVTNIKYKNTKYKKNYMNIFMGVFIGNLQRIFGHFG